MRIAEELADWAASLEPTAEDLALADRSLRDTLAAAVAAKDHPVGDLVTDLSEPARWATLGHVLDYDDLHMASTTHISVVCVPAVLAVGGDAHAYLAAAGVMARLGAALGWSHYSRGWHATCTAGAPAAAAGAAVAMGLDADGIARAMALAVPAAGGLQRAFGTAAKSLQVGFAADAGVRAAKVAAAGATADTAVLGTWLELLGGEAAALDLAGPAVPGGLAIKMFPCCYALQRPIDAVRELVAARADGDRIDPASVERVVVVTPAGTVQPLIHSRPGSGLEGKFSLEYAIAATLLDWHPGLESFTDQAVRRPEARELIERVEVHLTEGGDWLLAGEIEVRLVMRRGAQRSTTMTLPIGAPGRPPTAAQLATKLEDCAGSGAEALLAVDWDGALGFLRETLAPVGPVGMGR